MKRIGIDLYLESGPKDVFDPKSPQQYRVVAEVLGDGRNRQPEVLVLTPTMSDPRMVMDSFRRSIFASVTRFEAGTFLDDLAGLENGIRSLETRTEELKSVLTSVALEKRPRRRAIFCDDDGEPGWPRVNTTPGRASRKSSTITVQVQPVLLPPKFG